MAAKILKGDCRDVLRTLPADSAQCVVTSPPYWGLRDYGVPPAIWNDDPECSHEWGDTIAKARWNQQGQFCQRCGAWAGAFGLEPTYQLYVEHAVEVFREVRRVLRPDGTLWLNIGDSYNAHPGQHKTTDKVGPKQETNAGSNTLGSRHVANLKPKDLVGIPWRVAFALQEDGWWLRQDIIWSKPNPMPESVTDRCTKAHEYLFLMTKSERYHYDADAIKEAGGDKPRAAGNKSHKYAVASEEHRTKAGLMKVAGVPWASRNRRSVWTIATAGFPETHFATFPPDLVEPCILAGCPIGGTVLDPFLGAGTTALVADRLSRDCIGIELNPEYAEMARNRLIGDAGMFAEVADD